VNSQPQLRPLFPYSGRQGSRYREGQIPGVGDRVPFGGSRHPLTGVAPSTLPPLDVVGLDGFRLTLRALDRDSTVGSLAQRLDTDALWTTRELHPNERLADVDELRIGTRLARSGTDRTSTVSTAVLDVAVTAGPAATSWRSLPAGRHLIGRSPLASIKVDDPGIEPHHAVLHIDGEGSIELIQLTGSVPIRVDGRAVDADSQPVVGSRIIIGSSVIELRPTIRIAAADRGSRRRSDTCTGSVAAHPNDPWRRIVWRAPFDPGRWAAVPVVAPVAPNLPRRPAFTGLIGAAVTAGGAVAIALVVANPMFMMFAAMGVLATVVTFMVGAATARRARHRIQFEYATAIGAFRNEVRDLRTRRLHHHTATVRTVLETVTEALGNNALGSSALGSNAPGNALGNALGSEVSDRGTELWQRRVRSDDAVGLVAVVGTGSLRWSPPIEVADPSGLDVDLLQEIERCGRLDGVSVTVTIRPGDAVAIRGNRVLGHSVARSVITQLATWVGPADWQLVIVTSDERSWRWADWLPHGALDGRSVIVTVAGSNDVVGEQLDAVDASRMTLLVTDEPHLFTARTGPLRRFVGSSNAASLVVVDHAATVPAICRRVLTIGSAGSASWSGDVPESDDSVGIEFVGISIDMADEIARRLACLIDPEDDGGSGGGVPTNVSFAELIGQANVTAEAIAARWRSGGRDPAPIAPLGVSVDGRVDIDLVRDGPHGLIAGTTGAGKSELLRTLVLSLAASVGPQHLNFILVDYKGGSTFDACTALPHTVGLVTDLDNGLAERALVSLDAELHRRERLLRTVGASDLTDYRARRSPDGSALEPVARLVVVIDEFAALAKELPGFLSALVGTAQRGRSLGVHLLLATQRPAGVVNDDIKANTNLRLALRLHDRPDAIDVVNDDIPVKFPRGVPGRAALRLGPDELVVFQAARCTGPMAQPGSGIIVDRLARHRSVALSGPADKDGEHIADDRLNDLSDDRRDDRADDQPTELDATVQAIVAAATTEGLAAPHRPWLEPLPFPLAVDGVLDHADGGVYAKSLAGDADDMIGEVIEAQVGAGVSAAIGLLDDPEHQARRALSWQPTDGSLALVGSVGSGTTSTMIALAAAICGAASPDELHLYVIDARGDDGLSALASLAHCGGVVRLTEDERLHRLLARVVDVIDRRIAADTSRSTVGPEVVVMIDGYGSLRHALSAVERMATFDLLLRVVNDGPSARVVLVVADDAGPATTSLAVTNRWLFHLSDPSAARGLGLRSVPVERGKPGRLRVLASGLEGQVAQGAPGLAALPTRDEVSGGPEPIAALPTCVDVDAMRALGSVVVPEEMEDSTRLIVGLSGEDLRPTSLDVAIGDHVLVIGGPRTGVTTTLARCADEWERIATERAVRYSVLKINRRTSRDGGLIDPVLLADEGRRIAVVIDDAHRVDDDGTLMKIAQGEFTHVTLLIGARADGVRSAYGHWTREVAKSRCGVVMATTGDPDGDLLGVQIQRRPLIPARPGLAWIVDGGPLRQVQVARTD
jgi:DNA segregation ATPase FtsK/SpoIIIE, S-DNA-T family